MVVARIVCGVQEIHSEIKFPVCAYNLDKLTARDVIRIGTIIGLQHKRAFQFFEDAMHPDLEELQQRDVFLAKLERECPVRIEGADLVTTIPDIDAATLAGVKSKN